MEDGSSASPCADCSPVKYRGETRYVCSNPRVIVERFNEKGGSLDESAPSELKSGETGHAANTSNDEQKGKNQGQRLSRKRKKTKSALVPESAVVLESVDLNETNDFKSVPKKYLSRKKRLGNYAYNKKQKTAQPGAYSVEENLKGCDIELERDTVLSEEREKVLPDATTADISGDDLAENELKACVLCDQQVRQTCLADHLKACFSRNFKKSHTSEVDKQCEDDEALARRLQQGFDSHVSTDVPPEGALQLVLCQVCHGDLSHLTSYRRKQHVNSCGNKKEAAQKSDLESKRAVKETLKEAVLDCPMCGKPLKTENSRNTHIKRCAKEYAVAPDVVSKLVQQQRREYEVKLAAGIIPHTHSLLKGKQQNKSSGKQPSTSKSKKETKEPDEDTQFAMALSTSMVEEQQKQENQLLGKLETIERIAVGGKKTNVVGKKGRKKKGTNTGATEEEIPALLKQTTEEIRRKIAEKVAQIVAPQEVGVPIRCTPPLSSSSVGQRFTRMQAGQAHDCTLWRRSYLTEKCPRDVFYVENLQSYVHVSTAAPCALLRSFSSIPGRRNSTESETTPQKADPGLPTSLSKDESIDVASTQTAVLLAELADDCDTSLSQTLSCASEPAFIRGHNFTLTSSKGNNLSHLVSQSTPKPDSEDVPANKGDKEEDVVPADSGSVAFSSSGFCAEDEQEERQKTSVAASLQCDLLGMVDNPAFSDICIVTAGERVVRAHRVLLMARCPSLKQELLSGVEELDCQQFSHQAVLAALRFVYSGELNTSHFNGELLRIAERFGLKELDGILKSQGLRGEDEQEDNKVAEQEATLEELLTSLFSEPSDEETEKEEEQLDTERDERELDDLYQFMCTQREKRGNSVSEHDSDDECGDVCDNIPSDSSGTCDDLLRGEMCVVEDKTSNSIDVDQGDININRIGTKRRNMSDGEHENVNENDSEDLKRRRLETNPESGVELRHEVMSEPAEMDTGENEDDFEKVHNMLDQLSPERVDVHHLSWGKSSTCSEDGVAVLSGENVTTEPGISETAEMKVSNDFRKTKERKEKIAVNDLSPGTDSSEEFDPHKSSTDDQTINEKEINSDQQSEKSSENAKIDKLERNHSQSSNCFGEVERVLITSEQSYDGSTEHRNNRMGSSVLKASAKTVTDSSGTIYCKLGEESYVISPCLNTNVWPVTTHMRSLGAKQTVHTRSHGAVESESVETEEDKNLDASSNSKLGEDESLVTNDSWLIPDTPVKQPSSFSAGKSVLQGNKSKCFSKTKLVDALNQEPSPSNPSNTKHNEDSVGSHSFQNSDISLCRESLSHTMVAVNNTHLDELSKGDPSFVNAVVSTPVSKDQPPEDVVIQPTLKGFGRKSSVPSMLHEEPENHSDSLCLQLERTEESNISNDKNEEHLESALNPNNSADELEILGEDEGVESVSPKFTRTENIPAKGSEKSLLTIQLTPLQRKELLEKVDSFFGTSPSSCKKSSTKKIKMTSGEINKNKPLTKEYLVEELPEISSDASEDLPADTTNPKLTLGTDTHPAAIDSEILFVKKNTLEGTNKQPAARKYTFKKLKSREFDAPIQQNDDIQIASPEILSPSCKKSSCDSKLSSSVSSSEAAVIEPVTPVEYDRVCIVGSHSKSASPVRVEGSPKADLDKMDDAVSTEKNDIDVWEDFDDGGMEFYPGEATSFSRSHNSDNATPKAEDKDCDADVPQCSPSQHVASPGIKTPPTYSKSSVKPSYDDGENSVNAGDENSLGDLECVSSDEEAPMTGHTPTLCSVVTPVIDLDDTPPNPASPSNKRECVTTTTTTSPRSPLPDLDYLEPFEDLGENFISDDANGVEDDDVSDVSESNDAGPLTNGPPVITKTPNCPEPRKKKKKWVPPSPFTPMLDYNAMETPKLKKEMQKFGIKPVSKKRMILCLQDIYAKTHQYETDTEAEVSIIENEEREVETRPTAAGQNPKPVKLNSKVKPKPTRAPKSSAPSLQTTQKTQKAVSAKRGMGPPDSGSDLVDLSADDDRSDGEDDSSGSDMLEESFMVDADSMGSQQENSPNLQQELHKFFTSNHSLHSRVLMYEPLEFDWLKEEVKKAGIKCSQPKLINYMDEKCITFTMKSRTNRQRKGRRKKVKKTATETASG